MFGLIGPLGIWELVLILTIALIIFGPGKLPDVGKALGKGIKEFKNATKTIQDQVNEDTLTETKKEIKDS